MKFKVQYFFICFISILSCITSCDDLDNYSTNPSHLLSFSHDTLRLDTILTNIGTSTHILKVYNHNKEALLISSIQLADHQNSGFRINVDGIKGHTFNNVEIRQKDSLFIFIEATLEGQDCDMPFFKKDSIVFITNGVRQDVKLLAYGQDFIPFKSKTILNDTLIDSKRPIVIYDSLVIAENTTLTLAEGVKFYFHGKSGIQVYGRIIAEGTVNNRVQFRGDRTDNMFPHLSYDRLPGQWDGIKIHRNSSDNIFNYVDIHGGIFGIRCDSTGVENTKLTLSNSIIHQVSGDALQMTDCKANITNSQLSNAGGFCVNLMGGDYNFIHCTLANYYSWDIKRGVALRFTNIKNNTPHPLINASFRNCIIAGSSNDEISGVIADDKSIAYNYYFANCLINSIEENNEKIVDVIWSKDDHFQVLDNHEQRYDFRLKDKSQAIGIASTSEAAQYPFDLNGISRVSDDAPDAGCYEMTPEIKP